MVKERHLLRIAKENLMPRVEYPRTLYASGHTILGMPGSRIYHVHGNQYTRLSFGFGGFQPTAIEHNHYEVAVFGDGSWWLATGTTIPNEWNVYGGSEPVIGDPTFVQTGGIVRPQYLFYWITKDGLARSGLTPGVSRGWIDGYFPAASPP
jgi:hypothetical protein